MNPKALVTLAALLLLIGSGCTKASKGETGEPAASPAAADVPAVPAAKVARADLSNDLLLTAEFDPFQEIDVMSKIAGFVQKINVDVGDRVQAGQLLATLEVPEMQDELAKAAASVDQADAEIITAQDEIRRAQSAHDMAHLSFTRLQDVSKREPGLVPQQEVDEIHSRDLVSEAQVAGAESGLRTAQQHARVARAEQGRLNTLSKYTSITAPYAGVITKRYANTGSMIQAGTASQSQAMPLVRLSQNNLLRLILPVPESAVARVRIGSPVEVQVPSIGKTFRGRVARFTDQVQQSTRTMNTEVDVPNPSLVLVPGMYAQVSLRVEHRDHVLSVPVDAIERSGATARVFTVLPSGKLRATPVTLGLETPQRVEVTSGVEDGDTVVVGRLAALKDGEKVMPKVLDEPAEPAPAGAK